ncbi:MAG: hypothetical protein HQM16_01200 [Deltaproteobacteria bacterium]|nr:hypothetical protein [Deltaproteobacteria bacterium]
MKTKTFLNIFLCSMLCLATSVVLSEDVSLSDTYETYHGIKIEKNTATLRMAGKLRAANLYEDTEIAGINCAKNTMVFFDNKEGLEGCTLSQKTGFHGYDFAPLTEVRFSASGKLKSALLAEAMFVQRIKFPKESLLSFDDFGDLTSVTPVTDITIGGQSCPAHVMIKFDDSGGVQCKTAAPKKETTGEDNSNKENKKGETE